MKSLIALVILLTVVMVSGCAHNVLKLEADVSAFMKDNTLSPNCKAGIAEAATLAPDTTAQVRIAAQAVGKYANKDSQEFKDCYTKTAFASFVMRGGVDEISKITTSIIGLGLIP
jgi:hypothetical protein